MKHLNLMSLKNDFMHIYAYMSYVKIYIEYSYISVGFSLRKFIFGVFQVKTKILLRKTIFGEF